MDGRRENKRMDQKQPLTVSDCRAQGIPVFTFGEKALDELHDRAMEAPAWEATRGEYWQISGDSWVPRKTYRVYGRQYGEQMDGFRYVVDHGHGRYTLSTIQCGQRVPESVPLAA